jgi:hypothetical protein
VDEKGNKIPVKFEPVFDCTKYSFSYTCLIMKNDTKILFDFVMLNCPTTPLSISVPEGEE